MFEEKEEEEEAWIRMRPEDTFLHTLSWLDRNRRVCNYALKRHIKLRM